MDNFNYKKFLADGSLTKNKDTKQTLSENAPGYDTRKFGEALPTLESIKAAHDADQLKLAEENNKNDYANSEEDYTDSMVMEKIKDIIKYHELDPSDVLEEIGQEFGIAFEFGRGQ